MLRYDSTNIFDTVGGLQPSAFRSNLPKLKKAKQAVLKLSLEGVQGFLSLPKERIHADDCRRVLSLLPKTCTDLIVLGIGGSDLGGRMLLESIGTGKNLRVQFGGSTTDPDEVYRLLHSVDFKKTCINIVSKSGGTIEPMSSFLLAREMLIQANGKKKGLSRIIATTDCEHGALHDLALSEGYQTLIVPSNVGGRFSVLSSVGLFPLLADGGNTTALLSGARRIVKNFESKQVDARDVSRYASIHEMLLRSGRPIHVLMPYVSKLRSLGLWYRQLFAESLGKRLDRNGKEAFKGLTPVSALGPEDQHSQLQLYGEGPRDKSISFIEANSFEHTMKTPAIESAHDPIKGYGDIRLADIVHAERSATAESLKRQCCPNETFFIDSCNEESIGSLIMFFEIAVAMMGELMDVNAFDQPGVELSKSLMKQMFK
jgi:glucose-6-phosphate isomerase